MNPLTNIKNQNLMNEYELSLGYTNKTGSWHNRYRDSAWIYIGGLNYELTEGDIICVFSQYGEIANINLVRDAKTGKSKGFAFICYEDQRSTVLSVDNFNGIIIAGRTIRVDHVEQYRVPKDLHKVSLGADPVSNFVNEKGCGPEVMRDIVKLQKTRDKELKSPKSHSRSNREHYNSATKVKRDYKSRSRSPVAQNPSYLGMRNPSPKSPSRTEIHVKTEPFENDFVSESHKFAHRKYGRSPATCHTNIRQKHEHSPNQYSYKGYRH
ncbi:unnamed protein product [Protopolystoma xenopodis]|uniref:RRM domain-containing protein n=1 Tax=Protopolystoma xenopodis TaxID=117903 RepID=A0A3S5FBP2_9PLAT|nr:unnamed protein product [Protopolystoma xenopodis]